MADVPPGQKPVQTVEPSRSVDEPIVFVRCDIVEFEEMVPGLRLPQREWRSLQGIIWDLAWRAFHKLSRSLN